MNRRKVLECQLCGVVLRELTEEEAQEVARRPYDFVIYCPPHRKYANEMEH